MVRHERGIILIATYLVIVVLLILGGAFMVRSVSEKRLADREHDSMQAFYLAEAGIDEVRRYLDDFNWLTAGTQDPSTGFYSRALNNQPLGSGIYNIVVSEGVEVITITSTGVVGGINRQVEATFEKIALPTVFTNALASGTDVDLSGASSFWIFESWVLVDGPVSANNDILLGDRVTIDGPQTENAGLSFPDFPDVTTDENSDGAVNEEDAFIAYYKNITPDGNEYAGDQSFGPFGTMLDTIEPGNNIVFVDGDADILLNAQWWGQGEQDLTIAATGDINIALPVNGADDRINLFSYRDVSTIGLGWGESVNATIYAQGSFYAYWGGEINGSIVAGDIIYAHTESGFVGDRIINYDDRIENDVPLGLPPAPGNYSVGDLKSWRQL